MFGITKFSDLGAEEFQQMLLRHQPSPLSCVLGSHINRIPKINRRKREVPDSLPISKPPPSYVDWYFMKPLACRIIL